MNDGNVYILSLGSWLGISLSKAMQLWLFHQGNIWPTVVLQPGKHCWHWSLVDLTSGVSACEHHMGALCLEKASASRTLIPIEAGERPAPCGECPVRRKWLVGVPSDSAPNRLVYSASWEHSALPRTLRNWRLFMAQWRALTCFTEKRNGNDVMLVFCSLERQRGRLPHWRNHAQRHLSVTQKGKKNSAGGIAPVEMAENPPDWSFSRWIYRIGLKDTCI